MTRRGRLLVPSLSVALMLPLLVGLGLWQVHRLAWKTALLARIDAAEAAPGVTLPDHPLPFTKVRVMGSLRPNSLGRYGADARETLAGTVLGAQAVALLDVGPGKPPIVTLLGWVPEHAAPSLRRGRNSFDGYVRPPDHPGWFSAPDDPAHRTFYTLDPGAIGPALGAPVVAPFTLVLLGRAAPGIYPAPADRLPRPPNDHLNYAITWFGLACVLLVVFAVHVRKVLRE